jgi:hypothetical protein
MANISETYMMYLRRLHKFVIGTEMKENNIAWVRQNIADINRYISTVPKPSYQQKFVYAVNAALDDGDKPKASKPQNDRSDYYRGYKIKYSDDDEWVLFNRALSYLVKANMRADNCRPKNCVKNPTPKTIEKYGLYKNDGIWYSTHVDYYRQKYDVKPTK